MVKFIYLGQISEEKGVRDIVDACQILIKMGYIFQINLYGPYIGWKGDKFGSIIHSKIKSDSYLSDIILFHGHTDDVDSKFRHADVHLAPSRYEESYGLVVVEAKKNSVPSIIYPSGGMKELIEDGVDGVVCRSKDAVELARCMKLFLDDPIRIERMGTAAAASLERLGVTVEQFNRSWQALVANFNR